MSNARRVLTAIAMLPLLAMLGLAAAPIAMGGVSFVATVTVVKVTVPASDAQDFNFAGTNAIDNGFTLDTDAGDITYPSQKTFGFGSGQLGAASIQEGATAGWVLLDVQCTGDSDAVITGGEVDLDVDMGESITCTYTNGKLPFIKLTKVTVPSSDPQDFYLELNDVFNTTLDTDPGSVDVPSTDWASLGDITLGERAIIEDGVPGWTLTDITCSRGSGVVSTELPKLRVTVDVAEDSFIDCTFTNTKDVEQTLPPTAAPTAPPVTLPPTPTQEGGDATETPTDTESTSGSSSNGLVAIIAIGLLAAGLVVFRPKKLPK